MDGIIFDVDGTLWNSTDAVAKAWTKAIEENSDLDLIVDAPLLNRIFGKTMDEICDIVFLPFYPYHRGGCPGRNFSLIITPIL